MSVKVFEVLIYKIIKVEVMVFDYRFLKFLL